MLRGYWRVGVFILSLGVGFVRYCDHLVLLCYLKSHQENDRPVWYTSLKSLETGQSPVSLRLMAQSDTEEQMVLFL